MSNSESVLNLIDEVGVDLIRYSPILEIEAQKMRHSVAICPDTVGICTQRMLKYRPVCFESVELDR